jgi:carboxyl-terminal processing protease
MRPRPRFASLVPAYWCLGAWLALIAPLSANADPSDPPLTAPTDAADALSGPATVSTDPDAAIREALGLERQHRWAEAMEVYEKALERWPERAELRHRHRLCEMHYRLGRRYGDRSYREELLRLPREQALELYGEILERIESHYVDRISLAPLVRRGLDNLEVALRDPTFLTPNAPGVDPSRVRWLRQQLAARRATIAAADRQMALAVATEACELARQALGMAAAPVVLEFTYGACDALPDDYSVCLTPDKLDDLYSVIDGNFVGLGVELKEDPKGLRLVGVIAGGPAHDAGLRVGDRITHIAGHSLAGLGLDEAAMRLQGPSGSTVHLVVEDAAGQGRSLSLVRREVEVRSVTEAKLVEPTVGVGYVRLDGFQKSSTQELLTAVTALQRRGMRFLVLDLRGNPGGLLDVAVDIADEFLDEGVIVSTRGRAANQNAVYRARPGGAATRLKVAVLVDHDSASASEILAGALKDNRRAIVLGERSFGKGSVQSIFPLRAAPAGLKLTTAKFYSPENRAYSEQGVEPDVTVRVAARPAGDQVATSDPPAFGDPASDAALQRAIALIRGR